jgi:hypothetical protein
MKAVIAIISDDHVGLKIPGAELAEHFPFLGSGLQGVCPFFSRNHPFHNLFKFIGETLDVFPEGECEPFGGLFGFPARFAHIPPILSMFADVPRRGTVILCPSKARHRIPLTSLMHFQPPLASGDVSIKSYKIYRGAGEFIFSGFVHKNGKSAYLLVGKDKDAPVFIGRGFKGDNLVAILVYGLNDLKKVKQELAKQFSEFHLQEASKADIKKLTDASAATDRRNDSATDSSNSESRSRDRNGS